MAIGVDRGARNLGDGVRGVVGDLADRDAGPLFAGMVTYVVPTLALVWGAVDGEVITDAAGRGDGGGVGDGGAGAVRGCTGREAKAASQETGGAAFYAFGESRGEPAAEPMLDVKS